MPSKTELRDIAKLMYAEASPDYMTAADDKITALLLERPEFRAARVILFYSSIANEVSTRRALHSAVCAGKTVCLPFSLANGIMTAKLADGDLHAPPGRFGILSPPESARDVDPNDIDLIIVPALAYDKYGNRLGHGGGYYDRFLKKTRAYTVGLIRERFIIDEIPCDELDVGVKCLITETGVRCFV